MDGIRATLLHFLIAVVVSVILVIAGFMAAMYWVLNKQVVLPVTTLQKSMRLYRETMDHDAAVKELGTITLTNEIGDLAGDFTAMISEAERKTAEIVKLSSEKERISAELELAKNIQASMLSNIFPAFPEHSDLDIYASITPAKEVGGDFYDFFLVDDDHLCTVIADVSGKGVPAALFMMVSKIILQSCAMLWQSPGEILTKTNEAICSNNPKNMFVTAWVGMLKFSTGKLTAANAGHEYPMIKQPDGSFEQYKDKHEFVIGGMEGVRYKEYELQLNPGTKLFLYTDGVPEAKGTGNAMFGNDRMVAALNTAQDKSPEDVLKTVRGAVDDFVQGAEQFDDLTMLCIEYYGKDGKTQ